MVVGAHPPVHTTYNPKIRGSGVYDGWLVNDTIDVHNG